MWEAWQKTVLKIRDSRENVRRGTQSQGVRGNISPESKWIIGFEKVKVYILTN